MRLRLPWVSRETYEEALRRAQVAEDRLYAAWKDGYTVPARETVVPKEPVLIRALPEKVHAEIQNWESPEVRADLEREARKLLYDLNFPEERVLQLWADRSGRTPVEAA